MKHRAQASIFYVHTCVVKFTCRFLPCQSFKKKEKKKNHRQIPEGNVSLWAHLLAVYASYLG